MCWRTLRYNWRTGSSPVVVGDELRPEIDLTKLHTSHQSRVAVTGPQNCSGLTWARVLFESTLATLMVVRKGRRKKELAFSRVHRRPSHSSEPLYPTVLFIASSGPGPAMLFCVRGLAKRPHRDSNTGPFDRAICTAIECSKPLSYKA